MAEPVVIDLLRHGEVAANGWAFRGSTDVPLSTDGRRQMEVVGRRLEDAPLTQVAASPLSRCRSFAARLAGARGVSLKLLDDMREMDFGDWENRSFDELHHSHATLLRRFRQSPAGICPPGGEPFDAFAARVLGSWRDWLAGADGEHRLLVAHGGVIRVLIAHVLDMPPSALWRLHLPYASWSRVSLLVGEQPRLLFLNRETG